MSCIRTFVAAVLITLGASFPAFGHPVGGHDPSHHAPEEAVLGEASPQVGLDEHLGSRIPLDLTFRDESGRPVRLRDLLTGPTVIIPVYFGCSNVCNYLQGGLARVLPSLKLKPVVDYRVISVSMDETETPELAARFQRTYLSSMNAPFPPEGWRFLTGDARSIKSLTDAAGYRFQRRGHEFLHPVASFVVTGDGMIVRYLHGTNFLAKDLTLALLEAKKGQVGVTIRSVVGYCFRFDPATRSYQLNLLRLSATVVILCCGGFLAFLILSGRKGGRKPSGGK